MRVRRRDDGRRGWRRRFRAPLIDTIWSAEAVAGFRAVKEAFDPAAILNLGVILPLPGQRPLDAIHY
ncbi:MAG: hypothetical protein ACJ8GN_01810 [Longimicrobiaceae bacterium]